MSLSTRQQITRRWFFEQCGVGLGTMALADLLAETSLASNDPADPLAPRKPPLPRRPSASFSSSWPARRATWSCSTTSRNWPSSTAHCRRRSC